jgi:hypothetical protein
MHHCRPRVDLAKQYITYIYSNNGYLFGSVLCVLQLNISYIWTVFIVVFDHVIRVSLLHVQDSSACVNLTLKTLFYTFVNTQQDSQWGQLSIPLPPQCLLVLDRYLSQSELLHYYRRQIHRVLIKWEPATG